MPDSLNDLRRKGTLAHKILAMTGCMGSGTGHVFVRTPEGNEFLARSRHAGDTGPMYMGEDAYHRINMEGRPTEDMGDWIFPPERNIAMPIFKARPEVNCVIHAHPMYQVLCSIANVPLRPILGGPYGGEAVLMAVKGIPVYPRSSLISSNELGRAVYASMGAKDALILAGHGNVVTGRSVEDATLKAVSVEHLAMHCWQVAISGRHAPDILLEDLEELMVPQQPFARAERNAASTENWLWEYYVKLLNQGGAVPAEVIARQRFG